MNEFSPEQPQAARQFSSSCAESHPATLKSWGLPDGTPTRDAETSEAQQEESGLSIEPTPAESRQSTMPTQATHCIASGESDAEAPAGLHTNEQAGSHDCELVVAPTGQGSTASSEAKADRALPVTIITRKETNTMSNETIDNLTPGEDGVQEQNSCPESTLMGSNVVVDSCDQSTVIGDTTESTIPGFASGEPNAEAPAAQPPNEQVVSHDCDLTKESDSEPSTPASCEAKADGTSLPITNQTIQPRKEPNTMCNDTLDNLTPGEDGVQEQNSCPKTTPMGSTPVATPCDHTPVIDDNIESTTPSAAAIASANLNSGTDFVATTNTNTVMNTTSNTTTTVQTDDASAVTIVNQNSNAVDYSTFPDIRPEAWVEIFNDVLVDETPGTLGHRGFNASEFSIEEGGAYLEVCLTADDEGILKIENADNSEEVLNITAQLPEGEWTHLDDADYWQRVEYKYLPEGNYRIIHHLYNNPDYGTTNNRALYRFRIKKLSASDHYIPIVGESVRICCNCVRCVDKEGNNLQIAVEKLPSSSKYECMSIAEFVLKGGTITDNTRSATAPCGYLKSISPFAWTASVDSSNGDIYLITPREQVLRFCRNTNTNALYPVGSTAIAGFQLEQANEDSLILHDDEGQKLTFSISSGKVTAYADANGCITTAEDIANQTVVEHNADGNIKSVYSAINGYSTIVTEGDGSVLISWFSPAQVSVLADSTIVTSGEPYKTARYAVQETETARIITMTRQQKGMTPHVITRTEEPGRVTITNGLGDEAIVRVFEQNINTVGQLVKTETLKKGENVASSTASVYCYSPAGWLIVKKTEAYGTPVAQNTYYHYNAQHLIQRMANDVGDYTVYEYDSLGRITREKSPWGASLAKVTRTTYATARFFDVRPASVSEYYVNAAGTEILFRNTANTYEESTELERVTKTVTAGGSSLQQVSIEETFGSIPAYAYAAGKPKFSQDIDGVQTVHEYAATNEHDAIHKHTSITMANGELVAAQSRKNESFIAADDTVIFEQESIWDGTQWLLLNTTAYEYEEQQRVIKTTRGNGRSNTTTWMCCGRLSETDEDGITTTYTYDSARQLTEISRDAVYDGETCITPETITEYTRDAAGRVLTTTRRVGAMETTESMEYDALGRVTKQTDVLGRITSTTYSSDGLTTSVTTPAGATSNTTLNTDGTTASISGTAQRALVYAYDLNGNSLRTTTKLADGTTIAQRIVNGFGQTTMQAQASTSGFIYTRSEFNAKGQLVKLYQDTGWNTAKTAATLYEYDLFGNVTKQTLALSDTPTKDNSPVIEMAYSVESAEDGVFSVTSQTRYNATGEPLSTIQKHLISQLTSTLVSKSISIDVRGNSSTKWAVYSAPAKITSFNSSPTSEITAEAFIVDGFIISQKDHAGIITTASRSYTSEGMCMVQKNGRNNVTTVHSDLAGRTIRVTDAANASRTMDYEAALDKPAVVTDALGNTTYFKYDLRGRKIAEWGTAIQPACFGYDDMDNMINLRTFRSGTETISTDPSERTDYDQTTWEFHPATGLELSKAYADGTTVVKTYDAYNRLATETDARGNAETHSYEHARGLRLSTVYTVVDGTASTAARSFSYNHLGKIIQVVDDAGGRSFGYNRYGELESDTLAVDGDTHLITEQRDSFGRSTGYTYAKNGAVLQTVTTSYGDDGRICSAGFLHGGTAKNFGYTYLAGTNLLQVLTKPNGMTLTQTYEASRNLLTGIAYHRGSTLVAQRSYTYDLLGRPTTRITSRQGTEVSDTFVHNNRSELVGATVNNKEYEYTYDNIGNRQSTLAGNDVTMYDTNALNQYTTISENGAAAFVPQFDADGNQTHIKTSTGIWSAVYNAENRPVSFTNNESNTVVECAYDSMGRRAYKKVTVNGSVTLHQRYIYRNYQQIACIDLTRSHHPCLWLITWDPTQPIATRPLAIQKDGTWYTYGWDLNKNVCEVFGASGYIVATYTYAPYGSVTSNGSVTQPIQWSSEYYDNESKLHYYNFRYFNAEQANWISRDNAESNNEINLYIHCLNAPINYIDYLGNRRVNGFFMDGPKVGIKYEFDVLFNKENLHCFLSLVTTVDITYGKLGTRKGLEALLKEATTKLQEKLNKLSVDFKLENNPKCCCKDISIGIYTFVNDENIRKQLDLKANPHPINYNPTGKRSNAANWEKNNATVIIHEVLHLFGVIDEYLDEIYYPNKTEEDLPDTHDSSIMGNTQGEANIYPSHLEQILKLSEVNKKELKDCSYSIKYTP